MALHSQAAIRRLIDENPDWWFDLQVQRPNRPALVISVRGRDVPWCVSFLFRLAPDEIALHPLPGSVDDWTPAQRARVEAWRTIEGIEV